MLLGEGSFHQFHGGVATNTPKSEHPGPGFAAEYAEIRGRNYAVPERRHQYLGDLPPQAMPLLRQSLRSLEEAEATAAAPDSP